jgi:hypothetical protein
VVSTGDEILPEHLNLPVPASLQQIELQLKQILAEGSATEKDALKQILSKPASCRSEPARDEPESAAGVRCPTLSLTTIASRLAPTREGGLELYEQNGI